MRPRESYDESGSRTLGNFGTLGRLFGYLWPKDSVELRVRVVLAMVCLVAAKVAVVFVPVFYKDAVDALTGDSVSGVVALPVAIVLSYGTARVLSLAFGELRDAIFARVGQRAIRRVALEVFRHLHAMSLRFHVDRQTGGLSRTISRGVSAIEVLLRFSLFNIIPTLVEIMLVFGILWFALDIYVALVTIVTVIVYIAYTLVVTEWRLKFRRQMNESDSQANTKAVDSLLNFETVKYFGNEEHEAQRYDVALRTYEDAAIKSSQSLAILNVGQAVVISIGLTLVMLITGNAIVAGTMTIGGFVMANTYLMQLYQPLGFFGFVYREIKQSLIDIERMLELLDVDHEIADAANAPQLSLSGASVRFDHVDFSYDSRRPILKDVSFEVPAGKTVAFVGASGAGKSTISRLLYRFYDATQGSVSIDGQDVRDVTQASLRAAVGIVPQDTVLFNDTIYYNISYGRPGASPAEVEEAARLAQIHDFVMSLPEGYQSTVGERGLKLSGGEKQRVAIARTIIKNPAILVLDEATSALDSRTEQAILAKLRELSRGRTTLSIAHRLSTVVDADEILVLQAGQIVERGNHESLLDRDGLYAKMWQRQQEGGDEVVDDDEGDALRPA
ncbi:MAG: ABC-type transport system involved in Fe-S cluster assembly fused permease/ATPase subunit [Gammaproteobacteria bacterium]|jgi:ABC-type transport system involved in Fe-S cluster assembly fused permease/ATPase subunit